MPTPSPHPRPRYPLGLAIAGVAALALGAAGVRALVPAPPADIDAVAAWNRVGIETGAALERGLAEQRAMAMMHLAIHDALQAIRPVYEPYAGGLPAAPGASPEAAVAAAAHGVLVATVPMRREALDAEYAHALAGVPAGAARDAGVRTGQQAAARILALRAADGADKADIDYLGAPGIGAWEPTPPRHLRALLPGWAAVTPFALASADQFLPPPPPAPASATYARQYQAVKLLGGEDSPARTPAQSQTARFWAGNIGDAWNDIARATLARVDAAHRGEPAGLWGHARTFALLNMALADGCVAGWTGKYRYRAWRPVTAIRKGDADGNPATVADRDWMPYLPTPEHPEYPSTHSVLSGAASKVLQCSLGSDRTDVDIGSRGSYAGLVRHVSSFSGAAAEVAMSRLYAGAHFPVANTNGLRQGRRIGGLVCDEWLRPLAARPVLRQSAAAEPARQPRHALAHAEESPGSTGHGAR